MSYKNPKEYCCEGCNYITCYSKDFKKHINTKKHIMMSKEISGNGMEIEKILSCEFCNKEFKTNSGLWKHKQKCDKPQEPIKKDVNLGEPLEPSDKQLIMMLIKENSELRKEQTDIKELILELVKNGVMNNSHNTTNNTNTTNSHNKAFNLNFFLNETCKNAMNITDFVNSIKLQLNDLMDVGEIGFVEGISKIIVKNLNDLDETIRPIHCTDTKRETMYIKDADKWEKDDDNKNKLRKAIKNVADKNIRLLPVFRQKYPDYGDAYSKTSDIYEKMVIEAMTSDKEKDDKIIKNISKVISIDKYEGKNN